MKQYVVTGGAGFIGSALVRALLAEGDGRVRVIDNLLSGHEKNLEEVRSRIDFDRSTFATTQRRSGRGARTPKSCFTWRRFHPCRAPSTSRCLRTK